jgi:hypothetical protein
MRFGTPRYRKTKTFLGGLLRFTLSKTRGRPARLSRSIKLGPLSMSSTGRKTLSFLGFQIPIKGDDE